MLSAANRLRTSSDFTRTTRRGRKAARGCVVAYVCQDETGLPPRVGVIVSKAVGGSVQRHRAARRLRGAARPIVSTLPIGCTVVLRALPGADRAATLPADVTAAVRTALRVRT